jgi:hypothetical protein
MRPPFTPLTTPAERTALRQEILAAAAEMAPPPPVFTPNPALTKCASALSSLTRHHGEPLLLPSHALPPLP